MSVVVCGSVAFDNIMVFPGRFKDHINPEQIHMLNISFLVDKMRQSFGGCAGNIAYHLSILGIDASPMATVGKDFAHYAEWFEQHGISQKYIKVVDDTFTACAFITTDLDNNQICVFHPGAMNHCHQLDVPKTSDIRMGLISPEGREGMLQHAKQFMEYEVPYIFDPGQGIGMFDQEEMGFFIEGATWLACNDYEFHEIQRISGLSAEVLKSKVKALFVTKGDKGSVIYAGTEKVEVPVVVVGKAVDPTGCGDAYRAGIIYGLLNELDLEKLGHIAALMGGIQAIHEGTQTHALTRDRVVSLFEKHFSYAFPE